MIKDKISQIVNKMNALDINDDVGIEKCYSELISILSKNIQNTIVFFDNYCTDEEFYSIGSVFEDIVEKTQSREFIETVRRRLSLVTKENYNQEAFESEHMRKYVDYDEFCRSGNMEIEYAEDRLIK